MHQTHLQETIVGTLVPLLHYNVYSLRSFLDGSFFKNYAGTSLLRYVQGMFLGFAARNMYKSFGSIATSGGTHLSRKFHPLINVVGIQQASRVQWKVAISILSVAEDNSQIWVTVDRYFK